MWLEVGCSVVVVMEIGSFVRKSSGERGTYMIHVRCPTTITTSITASYILTIHTLQFRQSQLGMNERTEG